MNTPKRLSHWSCLISIAAVLFWMTPLSKADSPDPSLPHIVQKDGRYALFVDNAPYLILGAQVNNSSGWPAMLPKIWPAMDFLHVNTVEIPIYWEQFEPEKGKYDYTVIDTLLSQARDHNLHLIFLWFGTWKNGSNHYMPHWMKLDPDRYPNLIGPDGKFVDSPSPVVQETLDADIDAFSTLMHHLKDSDPQHTVLMVQVENESGAWGAARDFSPAAQKLFDSPVPPAALAAMGKSGSSKSINWHDAFGDDADEYFQAWGVASFIGKVAAAGKAIYPLPLYANVSLRDPINPGRPPGYESGGPTDNVIPLWKAAAPAIDILAPDIYQREAHHYLKVLDLYQRPDNALFVPETIAQGAYARFFFAALGHQTIGFSPFGLDYTRTIDFSGGPPTSADQIYAPTALNFQLIAPMSRQIASLNFEGKLQAAVDDNNPIDLPNSPAPPTPPDKQPQILHFPGWDAVIAFGLPRRFAATTRPQIPLPPNGRALVAQLADNQFLVTGLYSHVTFHPTGPSSEKPWQYLSVEEGKYENGIFKTDRILNGDQTDWGLIFTATPTVLRVTLYTR